MITTDWIDQQIAQRKAELEQVLANANMSVGELRGRIAQLEQMRKMVDEQASENGVERERTEAA